MTCRVFKSLEPPEHVLNDAHAIADTVDVDRVIVEDAVDYQWFIRVEDTVYDEETEEGLTKREFDDVCEIVTESIGDQFDTVSHHYGVGQDEDRVLIRIEY